MSTAVDQSQDRPPAPAARPARTAGRAIPFGRLLAVETRKLVDTRSGRWLLIVMVALSAIALAVVTLLVDSPPDSWVTLFRIGVFPVSILLPVLGILTMTSEWSQRTAMVTFALEPRRGRVLVAKVLATLVCTIAVAAVVAVLATAAAAIASHRITSGVNVWDIDGEMLRYTLIDTTISVLMGVAFGLLLGIPALAIVLYYIIPTVLQPLALWDKTKDIVAWIDPSAITAPLRPIVPGMPMGEEPQWSHAATAALVWIVVPFVVGTWRWLRREAK